MVACSSVTISKHVRRGSGVKILRSRHIWWSSLSGFLAIITSVAAAEDLQLPVREITVFKDGHALITHEGELATDDKGNATIDYVPTPVIGTFWAHSAQKEATLRSVASGNYKVTKSRSATQTRELLQANIGARVTLRDHANATYSATIVKADAGSSVVVLKTDLGTKIVPVDSIQDVTFLTDPKLDVTYEETKNQLRLDLDWGNQKPAKTARIGMSYLQRGIRWIPSYRLHLKGDGIVQVQMQATLLNEMTDLNDVTVHLLVGVPTFEFKGTIDPIALQQAVEQLSAYFTDPNNAIATNNAFAGNFSNGIMLQQQVSRMGDYRPAPANGSSAAAGGDLGPEIAGAGKNEDLFVYTVKNITLAKGERMIVQVGSWEMKYEDVYRLEIAATPPREVRVAFNTDQQQRLAQLYNAPKVQHVIRIVNSSNVPLTTAPALFRSDSSVLGQGMMTFTSPGGRVDVPLTTAINVSVAHEENEVGQQEERREADHLYLRFNYAGTIRLMNFHDKPVNVEVVRGTLGEMDSAGEDGKLSKPSAWTMNSAVTPEWWSWYSWPYWWHQFNSRGQAEWNVTIPAGKDIVLPYTWHYFWRT